MREGYRFLRGDRRLFAIILLTTASPGRHAYSRFLPVFATDVLHAGPSTFGLLLAAPGIGAVIAGLGIASLGRLRRRVHFVAMSVYAFALFLVLFSFCRSLPLSMLFLVLVGASNIAFRAVAIPPCAKETPRTCWGDRACFLWTKDVVRWAPVPRPRGAPRPPRRSMHFGSFLAWAFRFVVPQRHAAAEQPAPGFKPAHRSMTPASSGAHRHGPHGPSETAGPGDLRQKLLPLPVYSAMRDSSLVAVWNELNAGYGIGFSFTMNRSVHRHRSDPSSELCSKLPHDYSGTPVHPTLRDGHKYEALRV